jgi:hypothetical protein
MPKRSNAKKAVRKERNVVLTTLASPYNIMKPILDAKYAWVTHPVTRDIRHLATDSQEFLDLIAEFYELGIGERIERELSEFASNIDPAWGEVASRIREHLAAATANDADADESSEKTPE